MRDEGVGVRRQKRAPERGGMAVAPRGQRAQEVAPQGEAKVASAQGAQGAEPLGDDEPG
jgi:hypothetical protein